MMTIIVNSTEYKVKFGFNSFVDTDLMERTEAMLKIFDDELNKDDKFGITRAKELFACVRDLLFVGFQKYNPVEDKQAVGNLLDDYLDEGTEENPHDLMELFGEIANELMDSGFLKGLFQAQTEQPQKKIPKDHLKAQK